MKSLDLRSQYLRCVLGSGSRTGATLQAAAVPVGARTRTPGECPEAHINPGEDLVPEPSVQKQETETPAGRSR